MCEYHGIRPISTQLSVMQLAAENAVEYFRSALKFGFTPFFNSIGSKTQVFAEIDAQPKRGMHFASSSSPTGVPLVRKKLAELEVCLLQSEQSVEIPQVELSIHPRLKAIFDEVCTMRVYMSTPGYCSW